MGFGRLSETGMILTWMCHWFYIGVKNLKKMDAQFSIRLAVETDCSEIIRLIQELADYEKMPEGPKIGAEGEGRVKIKLTLGKDCN